MTGYRRLYVPGGTYFFTVALAERGSNLLVREIGALGRAVAAVRRTRPFEVAAWAVLPDHLHCVWMLPEGDADFSVRWAGIKAGFSRAVGGRQIRRASLVRKREAGVWQRRFWEHAIRDERDFAAHVDYTNFNAVKHGLVARPGDWRWSSFRQCAARGTYPVEWAGRDVAVGGAGEWEG